MPKSTKQIRVEIQADVDKLIKDFMKYREGGIQLKEIATFTFEVGTALVEAVEKVQGITGKQKKQVVMSTVKEIYKKVNPDIPLIPEPFETMIEDIMLDKALDAFIDFMVSNYKNKGIFQ